MIISQVTDVALNPENIEKLETLGYTIPRYYHTRRKKYAYKKGATIEVKIEDLAKTSPSIVEVKCSYCFENKKIAYKDYNASLYRHPEIRKYCCENCEKYKKREIIEYKQKEGLLKKGDKGYWNFKENRLCALDNYLKKYGTIIGMQSNKDGLNLRQVINKSGDNIEDYCVELGYKLEDIKIKHKPEGYYDDLENIKYEISKLCYELGRFPKQIEVLKSLHINNNYLLRHGGIREIKRLMKYDGSEDLVDDRGFNNSSAYEYMVAQYLISNNIPYKREQYPFDGEYSRLRSDFTLHTIEGNEIHVEVWGFSQSNLPSSREINYKEKRLLKEELYKKYGYILIGIDYEIFINRYEEIKDKLYSIFKPYLKLEYKQIGLEKIIPPNKLSDNELLTEIMKYSEDKNILPKQKVLQENGVSNLFLEVLNRYSSYYKFAKKYNKNTHYQYERWDKEEIFKACKYMLNEYGRLLKTTEVRKFTNDKNLTGIMEHSIKIFGSYIDARLEFYCYCKEEEIPISNEDKEYLQNFINCAKGFNRKTVTKERIDFIKSYIGELLKLECEGE